MKKLLISILIGLLLILSAFLIIQGIGLGGIKILGITGIKNKSEELNQKIQEAGKLAEKDYKQAVSDVETNYVIDISVVDGLQNERLKIQLSNSIYSRFWW